MKLTPAKAVTLVTSDTYPPSLQRALEALGGTWDRYSLGYLIPNENLEKARALIAKVTASRPYAHPSQIAQPSR